MSAIAPEPAGRSLELMARLIRAEIDAAELAWNHALRHAIRAGKLLEEASEQVKFGHWIPWLHDHGIAVRTSQRYRQLARNAPRVAHLQTVTDAIEALQEHVREDVEFDWEWSEPEPCTDWAEPPGEEPRAGINHFPFAPEPFRRDPRLWSPAKEKAFPKRGQHYEESPWVCPRCGHGKTKHDPPTVDLYGWAP